MDDNITIAMTLKNRASYLDKKLENLTYQSYDLKQVEINITDSGSTDNIKEVIEKWYKRFYQIKYAISDRGALPFEVPTNNPTCDINSQICNLVTFEKVIKTDPEVLFLSTYNLRYISDKLEDKDLLLCHPCYYVMNENQTYFMTHSLAGFCLCFNKSAYIESGGIDEGFAKGFSCEDITFLRSWQDSKKVEEAIHPVLHLYHGIPAENEEWMKLYNDISSPLQHHIYRTKQKHNMDNQDWKRPEMIKNIEVFKV